MRTIIILLESDKMKREEKIETLLNEDKIFLVSETNKLAYYICKGVHNQVYDVIHYKGLDKWKCTCNNVRLTECYHIEAVKRFRYDKNESSNLDSGSVISIVHSPNDV